MKLESSVLSHDRIRKLSEKFICIKVDPRDKEAFREVMHHKSTRYVPEVVFLSPEGEVVDRLEGYGIEEVARTMESVLAKAEAAR